MNVGVQAGLSVADGAIRAELTDQDYAAGDALLDAGAGIVGESFGNAARSFAVSPSTGIGRSLDNLRFGRSGMHQQTQEAYRGILEGRLGQIEAVIAGVASGLATRIGSWIRDDDNR